MKLSEKVVLPLTKADVDAMSAAEIDAAIAELRRRQKRHPPAKVVRVRLKHGRVWGDAFGGGFFGRLRLPEIPSIEEGWAMDAANLRGDMERVGCDMWIGVLQHALSEKRG